MKINFIERDSENKNNPKGEGLLLIHLLDKKQYKNLRDELKNLNKNKDKSGNSIGDNGNDGKTRGGYEDGDRGIYSILNHLEFINGNSDFNADCGEKSPLITCGDGNFHLLFGLGEADKSAELEQIGWNIYDYAKSNGFKSITIDAAAAKNEEEVLFSILVGLELSNYSFNKYLSKDKKQKEFKLEEINLLTGNGDGLKKQYEDFLIVKNNIFLCRDLVNEPSNVLNPDSYVDICNDLKKVGLEVEILEEKEIRKLSMNALLAVGQGSDIKPKVVIVKWNGDKKSKEITLSLLGKGVTFDSGGISLKPDDHMDDMKSDMAGSAVVLSTLKLLAERKAKVNVVGIFGLVENMPSGHATKPGDIVSSMSGKTIEVLNTDAEGRMVLADILYYAVTKFQPKVVIDLATLTGAVCVALGSYNAGIFSNNDKLVEELIDASKKTGENAWPMPLGKIGSDYDKLLDSSVADVRNISTSRYGGAITAAQFLQRFINGHKKWAHMDIAGTAFVNSKAFFVDKYATGYGVRLLNEFVKTYEK